MVTFEFCVIEVMGMGTRSGHMPVNMSKGIIIQYTLIILGHLINTADTMDRKSLRKIFTLVHGVQQDTMMQEMCRGIFKGNFNYLRNGREVKKK